MVTGHMCILGAMRFSSDVTNGAFYAHMATNPAPAQ